MVGLRLTIASNNCALLVIHLLSARAPHRKPPDRGNRSSAREAARRGDQGPDYSTRNHTFKVR